MLGTLFSKLISLESGIRSARNQKIALDFCFSVTQNHTYLSCDEPAIRSHFRGIVAKLEVHGLDAKAECLSSALDDLLLHPVALDQAPGRNSSRYGAVTSQVLAVLRCLEGDVSSLEWKGSEARLQQEEHGLLLKQLQQDFADTDDDCSQYSEHSSSDLSAWGEEPEQLPPSPVMNAQDSHALSCLPAAPLQFDFGARREMTPAVVPLQQFSLGQHWQLNHEPAAAPSAAVARACLGERCASGAYSSTVIVEEAIVVSETLLMLAGLESRVFSVKGVTVHVSADIAVASVSPSACTSWLQSWARVGSMCRRCVAVMHTDYEVSTPVMQVHFAAPLFRPRPFFLNRFAVLQAFVACLRDHLFLFSRFVMHTLELVRRGHSICLPPSAELVYPGSMIAMDCIVRQRVEQVRALHSLALVFDAAFSQVRPCRNSSHELLSAMHRRLQLHSSSWSYRSRATFVRFFRDCFMPVALQLDACLFASAGGAAADLLQLPQRMPRCSRPADDGDESEQDEGAPAGEALLLSKWHRGVTGADASSMVLPVFMQPLAAAIAAAGHAAAVLVAEPCPCQCVVDVLSEPSCVSGCVTASLDSYISQLHELGACNSVMLCGAAPFSAVVTEGIVVPLRRRCDALNAALLQQLLQQHDIYNWLLCLRRMFVGGDGETAFIMAEAVCLQLSARNSSSWAPDFSFSSAFQRCLSSLDLVTKGTWTAALSMDPVTNDMSPNLPELDGLDVTIDAPWPVSLVIAPALVQRYVKLLRFLLSLRVCHSVLTETSRYSRAPAGSNVAKWLRLRVHMLHIVNNLNNYATTRVVVGPGEDFLLAARNSSCLAELIAAQDTFLSTVSDRCLLNPKADTVASLIRMLLTLALRFSAAFRTLADTGDGADRDTEAAARELQVLFFELLRRDAGR